MDEDKQYAPLDTNAKETNHILIDFQVIFDLEIAAVQYIANHAKNLNLINPDVLKISSLSCLRNALLFRTTNNPLSVCISNQYKDSIDDIYNDIIKNHEQELLEKCPVNDLYGYFNMLLKTDKLVDITINCETDAQVDLCYKAMEHGIHTVIQEHNLAEYDTFYIKYVSDIIKYINIHKKKIYMINGMYNFEEGFFKKEILLLINNNIINVIDPYKDLSIPQIYTMFNDLITEKGDNEE